MARKMTGVEEIQKLFRRVVVHFLVRAEYATAVRHAVIGADIIYDWTSLTIRRVPLDGIRPHRRDVSMPLGILVRGDH